MKCKTLAAGMVALLLTACSTTSGPAAPDLGPLGDGLKVIGFALVAASVVITVGRLIR